MNRPNDERHFSIGSLIGGALKFGASLLPGGSTAVNIATTAFGALTGGGGGRAASTAIALPVQFPGGGGGRGGAVCPPGTPGCGPCPPGTSPDPRGGGFCVSRVSPFGIGRGAAVDFGDAVMGQFGAALEPAVRMTDTRVCPRGTVLGMDGLCYNKRDLKNTERLWPKGRAPLLTGGEMRCISIASRAANKLARKQKQLRSMGMLPPLPKARKAKALPPGHHAHVAHN